MASAPLLSCERLGVSFGRVPVLFDIDLEVGSGEIVAVLGTNGAGKSTLLNAIVGLARRPTGRIVFDDHDITGLGGRETARREIVHVPGGKAVFPHLRVGEHFIASRWLFAHDRKRELDAGVERMREQFPWLAPQWSQPAGSLSGGEQQQLALAMAFVAQPRLLVVDELSLGLSPAVVRQLVDMVRAIHAEGSSVLFVEQSIDVALQLADRAYFLERGRVRFCGLTDELAQRRDLLRSVFIGTRVNPHPVSRSRHRRPLRARRTNDDVVLEASGLARKFGGITAVDHATLTVRQHQILGLIGPNGAGKTTIFDLISGHLPLDDGRIRLGNLDVTRWPSHRRAAAGIGRTFQDARLFPALTVAETIALARERHLGVRSHVAAALGLPAAADTERQVWHRVDELVALLHLERYRDTLVAELSTGTRRVVELAAVLGHEPTVLLLDEPSSGLAHAETEALVPMLQQVRDQAGCAIVIIEHDIALLRSVCDAVVALDRGQVVAQGPTEAILRDPRVIASYLGIREPTDVPVAAGGGRSAS